MTFKFSSGFLLRQWQNKNRFAHTRLQRWILGGLIWTLFFTLYIFSRYGQQRIVRMAGSFLPQAVDLDQPPTYERLKQWEMNLPQHDPDLPFPEGRTGRYVLFKNQVQMLGWNNQLNEILMNTWLAYKSGRAYVFQDYIWKPDYYPWPRDKFHESVPHTPLNALISGPSAGGPWDSNDTAPRSVSERWFDIVCPKEERRVINTHDVKPTIYWENGDVIFNHWKKLLSEASERCIEVQPAPREEDGYPQVFDLFLWGSDRVLPLWDEFRDSPVSRLLKTSHIVQSAVDRNEYLFMPRGLRSPSGVPINPYERMLAIHLRRGDYKDACLELANWNSTFYSWNLLPQLPDHFDNPPGYTWGKNTPENIAYYLEHCYPSDEDIIKKINRSREDYVRAAKPGEVRYLDILFLLTNDKTDWVQSLKAQLGLHGWHTVATTRELELDQEQKDVGMAVDMDYARRAAVFIGNGWSSFTSNILHRRLVDRKPWIKVSVERWRKHLRSSGASLKASASFVVFTGGLIIVTLLRGTVHS